MSGRTMTEIKYYGIRDIKIKIHHTDPDLEKNIIDLHPEIDSKGPTRDGGKITVKMTMMKGTEGDI